MIISSETISYDEHRGLTASIILPQEGCCRAMICWAVTAVDGMRKHERQEIKNDCDSRNDSHDEYENDN